MNQSQIIDKLHALRKESAGVVAYISPLVVSGNGHSCFIAVDHIDEPGHTMSFHIPGARTNGVWMHREVAYQVSTRWSKVVEFRNGQRYADNVHATWPNPKSENALQSWRELADEGALST